MYPVAERCLKVARLLHSIRSALVLRSCWALLGQLLAGPGLLEQFTISSHVIMKILALGNFWEKTSSQHLVAHSGCMCRNVQHCRRILDGFSLPCQLTTQVSCPGFPWVRLSAYPQMGGGGSAWQGRPLKVGLQVLAGASYIHTGPVLVAVADKPHIEPVAWAPFEGLHWRQRVWKYNSEMPDLCVVTMMWWLVVVDASTSGRAEKLKLKIPVK